ncbi:hypothetical protein AVEN_83994-1 [Araneus ventricosus]|uniref:Uncharacterized protein n=1 Tax=Araneus ventricosus TaxID=182803 RepID=A0A4Y2BR38_ARAVE|nr:hypothetical protein AVEN_83994-1 [Araneus ventricosus]
MVWAQTSLDSQTDLYELHGGNLTAVRYREDIFYPYVRLYDGAIGVYFIIMDDNSASDRPRLGYEFLNDYSYEIIDRPAQSQDLNPIEHLQYNLGKKAAALNTPPKLLNELEQALLHVWSLLPISLLNNLIERMEN